MTRKERQKLREERAAAEREKDTVYYLEFVPLDANIKVHRTTLLNDPWTIRLFSSPKDNPQIIEEALRRFEANHKVKSWNEIAVSYQVNSFWYP